MVGRCLCAITYVLAFPASAMLLEFVADFLFGYGSSWGGGWRYMIPAGLVVGSVALVIEKGLYRFVGLWPKSWALFLIRSVILHTIYMTLVIQVSPVFYMKPKGGVTLAQVWEVLGWDPWFLIFASILAGPFGLLLGVANVLLLRPRAPDTLAAAVGLGMLALFVFAPPVGAWLSGQ